MNRPNASRPTLATARAAVLAPATLAIAALLGACGSSAEPTRVEVPVVPVASTTPSAAPRALRDAPLTATSPSNVIVDPAFLQPGSEGVSWGHWLAVDASSNLVDFGTSALGANPLGVGSLVASFPAKPASATGGKALDLLAPFPGGTGAVTASLWVSRNDASGQPTTFDATSTSITITILGLSGFDTNKGVDLARDESATTVIAGRTWYRYRADIADGLELAGFVDVAIDKSPGNWLLTGPEVLPTGLTALPQPMDRRFASPAHALRPNERAAIAAYRRLAPPRRTPARGAPGRSKRTPRPE